MEEITVVSVKPGFGEFDKINEIYEEAFPPTERMLTLEQMVTLPENRPDVNAYYCDGKIIGLSVLKDAGTFVYLLFFAVNKDARSSGFGGRILDRIIEDCGERPLSFLSKTPRRSVTTKSRG